MNRFNKNKLTQFSRKNHLGWLKPTDIQKICMHLDSSDLSDTIDSDANSEQKLNALTELDLLLKDFRVFKEDSRLNQILESLVE